MSLTRKQMYEIFADFIFQISPDALHRDQNNSQKDKVHKVYNQKGSKKLKNIWEAYHFLAFINHLIDTEKVDSSDLDYELHRLGLGNLDKLRGAPSDGGYTSRDDKGRNVFKCAANLCEKTDLELFADFLEFCQKTKRPLLYYDDDTSSEQLIQDIACIREYEEHLKDDKNTFVNLYYSTGTENWLSPTNTEAIPYIGRSFEFDELDSFAKYKDTHQKAKIWAIVGSSGAGKTRLAYHWAKLSDALMGGTD